MWKIKDTDDKQQNIDRMINMLTSLVGKINGLVSMEMGHNFNNSSEYDVVLYATFKNVNALKYYQNHPEHVKCKEFISGIQTGRVAADYFFEDDITKSKPFNEVPDAPEPIKKAPKVQETVKTAPKSPAAEKTSAPAVNATIINKKKPVQKPEKKTYINVSAEPVTVPKAPVADTKKTEVKAPEIEVKKPEVKAPEIEVKKPEVKAPEIEVKKPEVKAPEIEIKKPEVKVPEIEVKKPEVKVPEIEVKKPEVKVSEAEVTKSEPDPFDFSDDIPAAPMKFDRTPPASMKFDREPATQPKPQPKPQTTPQKMPVNAQVNPVSTEHSKIKETTNVFGKKKIDVDVTPLEQRSDTWTCPNCGKIMPNYVGTCGCGEIKPFDFGDDDIPAAPMKFDREPAPQPKPQPKPQTTPQKMPVNAQVNPVSTEHSKIKETTNVFGKKKIDVDVTPLEQRSDTWTCPNCGKIMPNYVGTCGCGEIKPFDFGDDDVPAAPAPKAEAPAPKRTPISRPAKRNTVKESKSFFGNKKTNTNITPVDQDANTWTCPNCGKVMPNYVGTCGCGETKPFDFNISDPTENSSLPQINMPKENAMSQEMKESFENAQPSIRGYNPQINKAPQSNPDLNYIKNDNGFTQSAPSDAPDISFMQKQDEITKNNNTQNTLNANQNYASPLDPIYFGDDNIPAAPMRFDDVPPAAPMRFNSNSAPAPAAPAKPEKKRLFGKKAKEEAVFQQAQAAVNSRKDVPNNGTWTCPKCGKVMPKYVGTCGCGEPQPFDF
jgi:predicted RNA-binding Zn-ribbon protein involved in translation (DUF1610 family)